VAGVVGDHSHPELLVPWLEPHVSPQIMRRSSRGLDDDSGYAIERDFQRLAAIALRAGPERAPAPRAGVARRAGE
jgi:hypothetical protein